MTCAGQVKIMGGKLNLPFRLPAGQVQFSGLFLTLHTSLEACKQFVPRSGPTNCGPNCLTLWWYSQKEFFEKVNFQKTQQTTKTHTKLSSMQRAVQVSQQ